MVSTSQPASAKLAGPSYAGERAVANLNARIAAYAIDSALLVAFVLAFFAIGGAVLLFTSNLGENDPPDSAYYAFVAVLVGGTLLFWSLFNIAMTAWRGQSAGMYVTGLQVAPEGGGAVTPGRSMLRWIAFHPLLFHPLLMPVWGMLAYLAVSLTLNRVLFVVTLALVFLCVAAPVAGAIALLAGPNRRALHDRLAGTFVVHLG